MGPLPHWKKTLQLTSVVNEISKGGFQKKDSAYPPESRVSQPIDPPPPHLYPQQQPLTYQYPPAQVNGQNSSYFEGHPKTPFNSSGTWSTYSPPHQGFPPTHENTQSQPPPPSLPSQVPPGYGPEVNHGQGSPPMGGYSNQTRSYGGDMYHDSAASFHSATSSPPPNHQSLFDCGYPKEGAYNTDHQAYQCHPPPRTHEVDTLQRSVTLGHTTYNNNGGFGSDPGYESPPVPLDMSQRSYTMPVGHTVPVDHNCAESWNP